jgi:SAM-dependent methyltransferase
MEKENKSYLYSDSYFASFVQSTIESAKEVIPHILNFYTPHSVVDAGCGTGAWLSIFEKNGISDILGIDGDYINREKLLISKENFLPADLQRVLTLSRKYDMAISLEAAEHIHPAFAETFISSLCNSSDVIVFSAAIPHQGGVDHVNEQYPEYWINHFAKFRFSPYDILREKIWNNNKINAYYRQNILFFVSDSVKEKFSSITKERKQVLSIVHPDYLEQKQLEINNYRRALKTPFHTAGFFIKKYMKDIFALLHLNQKNKSVK